MLKGFREFIMRGNVVDLAVGLVIGAAFGAVVKAFVDAIVSPLIAAIPGASVNGLGFFIDKDKPKSFVDVSLILNSIITFLLTAAVVYFVIVMPINRLNEMRKRRLGISDEEEAAEDIVLLREIRDALTHRGPITGVAGAPAPVNPPMDGPIR